jgi:hypothetical protein
MTNDEGMTKLKAQQWVSIFGIASTFDIRHSSFSTPEAWRDVATSVAHGSVRPDDLRAAK